MWAGESVYEASKKLRPLNQWYIGYNREMALEYILDCEKWLRALGIVANAHHEYIFKDPDENGKSRDIAAFRIRLPNGKRITALSSQPKNIRSKRGHVRVDEGAFHENLPEIRKAAIALTMHGGRVSFASTHDGEDNPFNELCEEARSGEKSYSLHTTTFDDAVEQGLYRKICKNAGTQWTQEAEDAWVRDIYDDYGIDADEELRCIPRSASGGYIETQWLNDVLYDTTPQHGAIYMSGDFAVTAKTEGDKQKRKRPDFTEIGVWAVPPDGEVYALDWWSGQTTMDVWVDEMIRFARIYNPRCFFGETGVIKNSVEPYLKQRMREEGIHFRCEWLPTHGGDKAARGRPMQGMAHAGSLHFPHAPWASRIIHQIGAFRAGKKTQRDDAFDAAAIMCSAIRHAHPGIEPSESKTRSGAREYGRRKKRYGRGKVSWRT